MGRNDGLRFPLALITVATMLEVPGTHDLIGGLDGLLTAGTRAGRSPPWHESCG